MPRPDDLGPVAIHPDKHGLDAAHSSPSVRVELRVLLELVHLVKRGKDEAYLPDEYDVLVGLQDEIFREEKVDIFVLPAFVQLDNGFLRMALARVRQV